VIAPSTARPVSPSAAPLVRQAPVALHCRAVAKSYRAGVPGCAARVRVLERVDLSIALGEVVVVVGAPASGKTTLARVAAGVAAPSAGAVEWFGRPTPIGIAYLRGGGPFMRAASEVVPLGAQMLVIDCASAPGVLSTDSALLSALARDGVSVLSLVRQLGGLARCAHAVWWLRGGSLHRAPAGASLTAASCRDAGTTNSRDRASGPARSRRAIVMRRPISGGSARLP